MYFKVEWENQIDNALTPLEAVKAVLEDIKNGESLCFTVTDANGKQYSVDLNETEGDEVCEIGE